MDKLRKFYSSWITHLIGFTLAVAPSAIAKVNTVGWKKQTLILGLSVVIFIVFDWVINKWGWIIFYPKYFFRGKWIGKTTYLKNGKPISIEHEIKIEQDCMSIKVIPSESLPNTDERESFVWQTIAMEIKDDKTIEFLYQVDRSKRSKQNTTTYGREVWKVVDYKYKKLFGIPLFPFPSKMRGHFYQCIDGNKPVHEGDVEHVREGI